MVRAENLFLTTIVHALNSDVKGSGSVAAPARGYPAAALPGITFDRFVRACVVVKQLTESFSALDTDRDGWIQLNYEKFLETVLTLP
jgi:peflin